MIFPFAIHVCLFSGFALVITFLPKPYRAVFFYAYLSIILVIGGFLGNLYSLPIADGIVVSGGNLAYGALMMTSVLFVLVERDIFVLRRIVFLVVAVNVFNILLMIVVADTLSSPDTLNPHNTSAALFATSIPFIILGGTLIVLALGIMLYLFELIKRATQSPILGLIAYLIVFIAILCLDGIAFPLIAFGTSKDVIAMVAGGLTGKLLTATAYSMAILTFYVISPTRFSEYLKQNVFNWGTLLRSSSDIIKSIAQKDEQLSRTNSRIAHSAELAGLGYGVSNRKTGKIVDCDVAYAKMHGLKVDDILSLDIDEGMIGKIVHPDDRQKAKVYRNTVFGMQPAISELRYVMPDGDVRTLRKIFSPIDVSDEDGDLYEVVSQDITDTTRLQEQLFKSQKMDAIGNLTGGVAHDFNNLLAVILGNLELLQDEITDADQKELLKNSITSTLRGAELTRNMLSFARKAQLEPTTVDLNGLIRNMKNWIGRTLPSNIDVKTSFLEELWETEVDASSAEAGILNLILNARDAMPDGGQLTIETMNVIVDDDYVELYDEEVDPGQYVLVAISDTGEGISTENLKHVFEPFFTTKPVGSGSGLGLSMIEGFMTQSKGMVRVYSELGVGTTFKLYFRASEVAKVDVQTPQDPVFQVNAESSPTILLVEDNVDVLTAIRTTLTKLGYRVIQATSGDAAFKIFTSEPKIDLLLTDIVMPGELQGTTLAKALRKLRPDLPVVFMSGYASEATVHGNGLRPEDIRLMKPVRREDLVRAVNKGLSMVNKKDPRKADRT
ncbi:PAS domain S-box-containing protein [Sulfitobacter marinus]|uniref:histidine kinase n=1 Tax=Sulfitobacter marinus TaxID=394264 RepID=A0A1I6QC10_9RHOB|nr:PAS domain S-box-containing protein [Sulfitobacter marinus]